MHYETEDFVVEEILDEEKRLQGQKISPQFAVFCVLAALAIIGLGLLTITRL